MKNCKYFFSSYKVYICIHIKIIKFQKYKYLHRYIDNIYQETHETHFLFIQEVVPLEWTVTTLQLQVHRITNDYLQGIFTENKDKIILGALSTLISKDLETNSEIEAQFHALRRLVASKIGFAAFITLPGFREAVGTKVVKALKKQNSGVTQAAIDCICALMQPMHDDCDLRQEQLNKSSLLSSNKFFESLLEMWVNHIVSISSYIFIVTYLLLLYLKD